MLYIARLKHSMQHAQRCWHAQRVHRNSATFSHENILQIGRLVNMYEFVLAGSEFHQHGVKGNTVPYQQMTTALQQEVNVRQTC